MRTEGVPVFCVATFLLTVVLHSLLFGFSWLSCSFQHPILAWRGIPLSVRLHFSVRQPIVVAYQLGSGLLFGDIPSDVVLLSLLFGFSWLSCSSLHSVLATWGVQLSVRLHFSVGQCIIGTYRLVSRRLFGDIPSGGCCAIAFVMFQLVDL